jgi:hypothetical protein
MIVMISFRLFSGITFNRYTQCQNIGVNEIIRVRICCLTPLSILFQLYRGGYRSTWRKQPTWDLNPIEPLWDHLDKRVHQRQPAPQTLDQHLSNVGTGVANNTTK